MEHIRSLLDNCSDLSEPLHPGVGAVLRARCREGGGVQSERDQSSYIAAAVLRSAPGILQRVNRAEEGHRMGWRTAEAETEADNVHWSEERSGPGAAWCRRCRRG